MPFCARAPFAFLLVCFLAGCLGTLDAQRPANSNEYYRQLRGLQPGGEIIAVNNLELHRDAAVFTFRSGAFALFSEVNGKVTGAVFKGEGHLHITPPTPQERHHLAIVNHTEEFDEDFDKVVLRFTDSTATELRKAATGKGEASGDYAKEVDGQRGFLRKHSAGSYVGMGENPGYYRKILGNLDLRLLADVVSPAPGGFFYAAIHGRKYSRLFFQVDPHGVVGLEPEEVALANWDVTNETMTYPLAFHLASEVANGTANGNEHNASYRIDSENIDISIQKTGALSSTATVVVRSQRDGLAVVPLNLYPTLRVSSVESEKGEQLDFVQEGKDLDWDFGVVLSHPLKKDETATLKITYSGKDAIYSLGGANYYPVARDDWYPSSTQGLADYATYRMLFHVPKGIQLVATGTKVREDTDGGITTSEWKTETPLPVVGFSLGDFKSKEGKFSYPAGGDLVIDAFANNQLTDVFLHLAHSDSNSGLGTLNTTPMLANELSQGVASAQIYTNYFGQVPFPHISLTQQTACNYGQSWPMLVYLPLCGFLDDTQRHLLIGSDHFDVYWKVVTPHEMAHQWWGQAVGFRSYRDQWMSEGFADTSATIYLQSTRQMDLFMEFWKQQRKLLTWKNEYGFRPIDIGPVTMGTRLSTPQGGWNVYENLVYPKGAYILHMIRMMMWTPNDGDALFRSTMHDFVESHRLQAATTEDFKAIVEKHMSPAMDVDGNHRMDWFFNEYVYGMALPTYHFEGEVTLKGDVASLHYKLVQSGVSPDFKMLVPIYLEFSDGRLSRLGNINITGSNTMEQTVPLGKLPGQVKRVSINHFYDVLSMEN